MLKINKRHIPLDLIAPHIPTNPIIVEAGAHIGRGTKKMSAFWPNGTIHAFEPIPEIFTSLKKRTVGCTNVVYHNYALSNSSISQEIFVSGGRTTAVSSLLEPKEFKKEKPDVTFTSQKIETIALDDWAKQNNINHVDLLWLDLQGAELLALQGATNILTSVTAIHIEVALTERYKNNPLYTEITAWLQKNGFKPLIEAFADPTWGNVLFIKKALL